MGEYVGVSIERVIGGYVVDLPEGRHVTTSLNKAIKLVRDALQSESIDDSDE